MHNAIGTLTRARYKRAWKNMWRWILSWNVPLNIFTRSKKQKSLSISFLIHWECYEARFIFVFISMFKMFFWSRSIFRTSFYPIPANHFTNKPDERQLCIDILFLSSNFHLFFSHIQCVSFFLSNAFRVLELLTYEARSLAYSWAQKSVYTKDMFRVSSVWFYFIWTCLLCTLFVCAQNVYMCACERVCVCVSLLVLDIAFTFNVHRSLASERSLLFYSFFFLIHSSSISYSLARQSNRCLFALYYLYIYISAHKYRL